MGWRVAFSGLGNGVFGCVGIGVYIGWSPLNQLNNLYANLRITWKLRAKWTSYVL
jgi:hypothetical protein